MKNSNENDSELLRNIQSFLDHCTPEDTPEDGVEDTTDEKIFDRVDFYAEKIKPLLDQIMELCDDQGVPFFAMVVSEINEESVMGSHNWLNMPFPICEMIAIKQMLEMPHNFTHMVIQQAIILQALSALEDPDEE